MQKYSKIRIDWERIACDADVEYKGGYYVTRILPESSLDVFVGIESPSKHKIFYTLVSNDMLLSRRQSTKGLETFLRHDLDDKKGRIAYGIILRDNQFDDIFRVFVDDIVAHLKKVSTESEAANLIAKMFSKWRLFMTSSSNLLSREEYEGLWGELAFLNNVILPRFGERAVLSWKGPLGYSQDFYLQGLQIEVKTTVSGREGTVRISNEYQLELPENALLLLALAFIEDDKSGESLNYIVNELRKQFQNDPECLDYFDDLLIQAGYLESHIEHYEDPKFLLKIIQHYKVDKGFPRIESSSLQKGLERVSYSLRITDLKDFIMAQEQVDLLLKAEKGNRK